MALSHEELVQAETARALEFFSKAQLDYMNDAIGRGVHPDYGMGAILSAMAALLAENSSLIATDVRDRSVKLDQTVSLVRKRAAFEKTRPLIPSMTTRAAGSA